MSGVDIVVLLKPTIDMVHEYLDFADEWDVNNEGITPSAVRLFGKSYEEWVKALDVIEKAETCPDNLVDAHTYFFIENKRIIGAINIRHRLNHYLLNYGGHIGYGIRPSERRKGYATKMLASALPIAKQLGLDKVLITCNKLNLASAKTIINNGGILENEVLEEREDGNEIVQRYWIKL